MIRFQQPPEWTKQALCAQVDPELFFPERGTSVRAALAVCRQCPVRAACLNFAIENEDQYGVWGGVVTRRRRALRRDAA